MVDEGTRAVLFPRHFSNPDVATQTTLRIQLFRDYLHYHISGYLPMES